MTQHSEKIPPEIVEEEDEPFASSDNTARKEDLELTCDKHTPADIDWRKLSIGSNTLGWCVALMFACVILSLFKPDNKLVSDAFEAFKLIVTTVLGYIFGSNSRHD